MFIMTLIFEWYVVWYGYKNNYKKDTCFKKIELHAQNNIILLS